MYYKLEPGSETYEKVKETLEKCDSFNDQAQAVVKELGFEKYGQSKRGVAGGISCLESKQKPEGYVTIGKKWQNLVYPKANNKAALKKIESLPVMTFEEFGKPIGFKPQIKGLVHHRACGVEKVGEIYLIEVDDRCDYAPAEGMVEILTSEYKKLVASQEDQQAEA